MHCVFRVLFAHDLQDQMPFVFGAETNINAPVETVWAILADLAAYPQWCPFTVAIHGSLTVGGVLTERVEMTPGAAPLEQIVTVTDLAENLRVTWVGKKYSDCLVHAIRTQSVRRIDDRTTHFVTHEQQTGALVWLVRCLYERELNVGAAAIAEALKARAEATFAAVRPVDPVEGQLPLEFEGAPEEAGSEQGDGGEGAPGGVGSSEAVAEGGAPAPASVSPAPVSPVPSPPRPKGCYV